MIRALVLLACCLATGASAASFDCGKAASGTEKLICSDASVSALDEALNAAYKRAFERVGARAVLRQSQRDWLSSYEVKGCSSAACLKDAFTARTELLADIAAPGEPGSAWSGEYQRLWRGKKDPNAAHLSMLGLKTGRVLIAGTALWQGPNASIGQVNTGDMSGIAAEQTAGKTLLFDGDGCTAQLQLDGDRITVTGESGCGGLNVTFDGQYRRIKQR